MPRLVPCHTLIFASAALLESSLQAAFRTLKHGLQPCSPTQTSRRDKALAIPYGLLILAVFGCAPTTPNEPSAWPPAERDEVTVFVVNYPLQYFTKRIGGEHVQVTFNAPADKDPAYWIPDAEQIVACQAADLILLNGAGYAQWVDMVSLPESKLSNTSAEFADRYITLTEAVTHQHGPGGEHAHGGTAFTTWLDPQLASLQCSAIRSALTKLQPQNSDDFAKASESLSSDLEALDQRLRQTTTAAADTPVIFSHPVYQYLERRYGLNGASVHWEPNEAPTAAMWVEFQELLARHPAKWMIWESEPMEATVHKLEQLGVQSIVFDPCGNAPEQGDYLTIMERNIDRLAQVYNVEP